MEEKSNKVVRNNLRVVLAKKKIRLTQIHKDTGISMTTISHIVNESKNPTLSTLIKLKEYLGVSFDDLLIPEEI